MTKNIVIGVYHFFGFHICNHLLNQGHEVIGVEWEECMAEYRDEKAMLFNRNANFTLKTLEDKLNLEQEHLICVNLYDHLETKDTNELWGKVVSILNQSSHPQSRILIFLPENMNSKMNEWKQTLQTNSIIQWVYVGKLYGPWLAEQDYQELQSFSHAIYVDDFCKDWTRLLTLQKEEIHVVGEYQDGWREQLTKGINTEIKNQEEISEPTFMIQAYTSLRSGLQAMKDHEEKLKMLQEWNEL
ncbi:hypothetical protein [Bacillus massiliigorillae]|uniref:hypothetical protein n=1 Tax=Bacillus massiliigorillae TaxID=1243664 RepID=UPI0003A63F69|nr:hypothetical protein [Bacillus massiliigorillae]